MVALDFLQLGVLDVRLRGIYHHTSNKDAQGGVMWGQYLWEAVTVHSACQHVSLRLSRPEEQTTLK